MTDVSKVVLIGWMIVVGWFFLPITIDANDRDGKEEDIQDEQTLIDQQLDQLNLDELKTYWRSIKSEYGEFLPETQKGSFMEFVRGEKKLSIKAWFAGFVQFFFHEIIVHGKLLGALILLTVFSVLLQTIQNAFEFQTVSKVAYAIVYMVLMVMALNSFRIAMSFTNMAIDNMTSFMVALMPLILALMASIGNVASVALFHPLIVFMINISSLLIEKFILPLLFLSAVLSIVSTISDHYKVTNLAKLLKNVAVGALGFFFTIFLGIISVQGATSAITDGVALRTAKFIAGNFIPVIGRMFTDAADTVMSASLLLKNTIGLAGVIILLLLSAFPAIKVLALAVIYHLAAAILQPLGEGPVMESLSVIAKSMIYIFAALAIVSIMFFFAVTIMIAAGNMTLMLR